MTNGLSRQDKTIIVLLRENAVQIFAVLALVVNLFIASKLAPVLLKLNTLDLRVEQVEARQDTVNERITAELDRIRTRLDSIDDTQTNILFKLTK